MKRTLYTVNPAAAIVCGLWSTRFYEIVRRYRVNRQALCTVRDVSTGEETQVVPVKYLAAVKVN